jgi:hypothetical protein
MSQLDLSHFFNNPRKKWSFTLEYGRGETYSNRNLTLYAHSTYGRESVLCGRSQRVFVDSWHNREDADTALMEAKKKYKKFKFEDNLGGCSHIPVAQIVSHLPDDTD